MPLETLNLGRITLLALADSVNPCAIAVLAMILMSILVHNPDKKRKVLTAGFSFIAAVFIGYLFYGLILIQFFSTFANFLRSNSIYIYRALAILAMILGALNVKDFFMYKRGSFATEMPLFLRPRVKRITERVSSNWSAFIIGFLVTLFLLPCTMGPYIIASGILSPSGFLNALPWLLYYNFIFVLPMIFIVGLVYFGFKKVEDVSTWKELNVKKLHLIAGILLFLVGISMVLGWI